MRSFPRWFIAATCSQGREKRHVGASCSALQLRMLTLWQHCVVWVARAACASSRRVRMADLLLQGVRRRLHVGKGLLV